MGKHDYSYGWEKLYNAVCCLAGRGDQKSRLAAALIHNVTMLTMQPNGTYLPPELQHKMNELMRKMTSVEAVGNEGTIQATVNSLTDEEVSDAVREIIDCYDGVCRYRPVD